MSADMSKPVYNDTLHYVISLRMSLFVKYKNNGNMQDT